MSGNGGREKQVSGPHKFGLLKKTAAETGNDCLSLRNDERVEEKGWQYHSAWEMKATIILVFRDFQKPGDNIYFFQHQEAAFWCCTNNIISFFSFFLNIPSSILIVRGHINDDVKLVAPEMTCHQIEIRKFQVTIERKTFVSCKNFTCLIRSWIISL